MDEGVITGVFTTEWFNCLAVSAAASTSPNAAEFTPVPRRNSRSLLVSRIATKRETLSLSGTAELLPLLQRGPAVKSARRAIRKGEINR